MAYQRPCLRLHLILPSAHASTVTKIDNSILQTKKALEMVFLTVWWTKDKASQP
jgi:hypothetical protein